jgi:subtilisin family serine protease
MISVASLDIRNSILPSSNWGAKSVDVAAPGENIYSTLPGGRYGYMTGTSQATAFVTGVAALLLSKDPTLTPKVIKQIIMASVDPIPGLKNKTLSGGKINAYSALKILQARNKPLAKYQKSCHTR